MERENDRRIDDLNAKVDEGLAKVDGDMKEGFARVDARFEKVGAQFDKVDERFAKLETEMRGGVEKVRTEIKVASDETRSEARWLAAKAEQRIDRLDHKVDRYWLSVVVGAIFIAVLVNLLFGSS